MTRNKIASYRIVSHFTIDCNAQIRHSVLGLISIFLCFLVFHFVGVSDLELSSFVEKASMQMTERTFRLIPGKGSSSNSNSNSSAQRGK